MAKVVPVITHASVTGAAANPNVLVDGPKWDANHSVAGLANLDDTADADKPVSTAQAAADAAVAAAASAALTTGLAGKQPLDSDLTAIAALSTTSYGRAFLALADAAAARTAVGVAYGVGVREILTGNRTYYVLTTGSDSNTGLANTAGGAFLTLQKAANVILRTLDTNGFNVTIDITGALTAGAHFDAPLLGDGILRVTSTTGATLTTTSSNGITASHDAFVVVDGNITFSTITAGVALLAYAGGHISQGAGVTFGPCVDGHRQAGLIGLSGLTGLSRADAGPGTIDVTGDFTASAGTSGSYNHATCEGAMIRMKSGITVTSTGTPVCTNFVQGVTKGLIYLSGVNWVGAVTGQRYYAHNGGAIIGATSLTSLPGSTAGVQAGGGVYVVDDNTNYAGFGGLTLGNNTAPETGTNTIINFNAASAVTVIPTSGGSGIHVIGADGVSISPVFGDSFGQASFNVARRADGTLGSKIAVAATTQIWANQAYAWDGSGYFANATFDALTFNLQSGTDHSSYWRVRTIPSGSTTLTESTRFQPSGGVSVGTTTDYGFGNIAAAGGYSSSVSTTKTANYTVTVADSSLIFNGAGSLTLTLLAAATYPGRWIRLKTIAAQTVVSATSNVVPLAGGAAGTAILAATAGKWADLQSDGTSWVIMAGN